MSKRHRDGDLVLPPRAERRAHARSERHRVTTELAEVVEQVSGGVEPDDAPDPGVGYRPIHHRDPARAKEDRGQARRRRRHWKLKMWKRRTSMRMVKARATRLADLEQGPR
ncbi:MAG TPA: hypothetical protein VID93_05660 [Acidimicrobiales bacterium]